MAEPRGTTMDQNSTASVITFVVTAGVCREVLSTLKQASAYFITLVMPKLDLLLKWVLTTSIHINFNVDISFGKPTATRRKTR